MRKAPTLEIEDYQLRKRQVLRIKTVQCLSIVLQMNTKVVYDIIYLGKLISKGQFSALKVMGVVLRPILTSLEPPDLDKPSMVLFQYRDDIVDGFQGTATKVSSYLGW